MPPVLSYDWYYNRVTGNITQYFGGEATLLLATGIWKGPFASKQAAIDFYNENKSAHPDYAPPTEPYDIPAQIGNTVTGANTAAKAQAGNVVSQATNQIFGSAVDPNTIQSWIIRIGEILLGLVLIGVGVAGWDHVKSAVKTTAKAAAVAA